VSSQQAWSNVIAISAVILRIKGQIIPFKPQDWPPAFLGGYTTHQAQHMLFSGPTVRVDLKIDVHDGCNLLITLLHVT
jgi:hypothetical protein